MIDAHCHLQDPRLLHALDSVMERSFKSGITGICCCGTCENDWALVQSIAAGHDYIFPSMGLHPWFVAQRGPFWLHTLEQMVRNSSCGIGEIGLDHTVPGRGDQVCVFRDQLDLARMYERPVSIHCQKAWGALAEILKDFGGLKAGGLIHSYSGSKDMIPFFEKMGCHISFSASVTRSANRKVRSACQAVSKARLLVETDSPDIMPENILGHVNEPSNLIHVIRAVSAIRGVEDEKIIEITCENTKKLFGAFIG